MYLLFPIWTSREHPEPGLEIISIPLKKVTSLILMQRGMIVKDFECLGRECGLGA